MLSQNLSDFNVHGDLVDVFLALRQEIPSLVLLYPFIIGGRHLTGPNPYVPPTPYQHQTNGGQTGSLQLTNASGRDVLSQATQAQTNHMYWIAEYAGTNVIASFFSKNDIDHDPELLERIRQAQEESEKGLGQNQGPQPK
jgi:hypothetical protein